MSKKIGKKARTILLIKKKRDEERIAKMEKREQDYLLRISCNS